MRFNGLNSAVGLVRLCALSATILALGQSMPDHALPPSGEFVQAKDKDKKDIGVGALVSHGPDGAAISTIAPVLEAHLTTPLTQRGANSPVIAPDLLVLVGGVHVGVFGPRR